MLQRYLGIGVMAAAGAFLTTQVLMVAFHDLPQVRKEEKALKDMSSPEKPFKPKWHKSIIKAVKRRVNAILVNPRVEVFIPLKVLGFCMVYFFVGHEIGYSQGLWAGANRTLDNVLGFLNQVVPEQFKPVVRAVLDKGIKKSTFFKNTDRGFFKTTEYRAGIGWEELWKTRYAEEVAKLA